MYTQGIFTGLLTIDMIHAYKLNQQATEHPNQTPLSRIFEAKDLLYGSDYRTPVIKANDRLSSVIGLFKDIPCIPVLGDDKRILGLLFSYQVRVAYERETLKKSFVF